jgi:hypothetical protein
LLRLCLCRFPTSSHICFCGIITYRCSCDSSSALPLRDIKRLITSSLLSFINLSINNVNVCIWLTYCQIKCKSCLPDPILDFFF